MADTFSELTGGTLGAASLGRLNALSGNGTKLIVKKPDVQKLSREARNELMAIGLDILVEVSDPSGGLTRRPQIEDTSDPKVRREIRIKRR